MDDITWDQLNAVIRGADEATCVKMLKTELKGERRRMYVLRIHSRLNRVRAAREREELLTAINGKKAVINWLR